MLLAESHADTSALPWMVGSVAKMEAWKKRPIHSHRTHPQRTRHTRARDPHPPGRHTVTPRPDRAPRDPNSASTAQRTAPRCHTPPQRPQRRTSAARTQYGTYQPNTIRCGGCMAHPRGSGRKRSYSLDRAHVSALHARYTCMYSTMYSMYAKTQCSTDRVPGRNSYRSSDRFARPEPQKRRSLGLYNILLGSSRRQRSQPQTSPNP